MGLNVILSEDEGDDSGKEEAITIKQEELPENVDERKVKQKVKDKSYVCRTSVENSMLARRSINEIIEESGNKMRSRPTTFRTLIHLYKE